MAFVHLFARVPFVGGIVPCSLSLWEINSSGTSCAYCKADACTLSQAIYHTKASLWGTTSYFLPLSVMESKAPTAYEIYCITSKTTPVIFCCRGFSFFLLCDDLLWLQDEIIPWNTILCVCLPLMKHCWLVPRPCPPQNKPLGASLDTWLKKGRRKKAAGAQRTWG